MNLLADSYGNSEEAFEEPLSIHSHENEKKRRVAVVQHR